MALMITACSLSGRGSILAIRLAPSFWLSPSTPAMKPVQNHAFSSSARRPYSCMACTAAGTRDGLGCLRYEEIQSISRSGEENPPCGSDEACAGTKGAGNGCGVAYTWSGAKAADCG